MKLHPHSPTSLGAQGRQAILAGLPAAWLRPAQASQTPAKTAAGRICQAIEARLAGEARRARL